LFTGSYKSRRPCFQPPRLNILIKLYLYSFSLNAQESRVQIGPEPEPTNFEPCLSSVAWKAKGETPERLQRSISIYGFPQRPIAFGF
jgi:hypothetical protein